MRRLVNSFAAAGAALVTIATGAAAQPASAALPHASAHARVVPVAYTPPPIAWGACAVARLQAAGAQCGLLTVPLDYANPGGAKIQIAVSRVLHKVSDAKYQGVMLVNPGGPGGSGLTLSTLGARVPNHAGDAYDWIGFDPRGVGSSVPALSCDATFFHGDRPPYRPTSPSILLRWETRSAAYAAACVHAPGSRLFDHVKTTDTVADMESLRIALGQDKINYYGFSYGTYLGQVYATLHPDRVRRFIFDGTVDPTRVFYRSNQDQDVAFQKTFDIYFAWLAKYHSVYDVGSTQAEVRDRYLATQAALDRKAAGGVLGGDELIDVFTDAGYYVYDWATIAQAYSTYLHTGDATALISLYTDANPTTPGADNGYAMYLGTQCTDAPWPHNQATLLYDNYVLDQKYNYFTWSNAWYNGPCGFWPYRSAQPVAVSGAAVTTPVLMINETFDAATPYSGSLKVRSLFPTASLVEGVGGSTHAGSLSGVACTDDTIADYLATGAVPTRVPGNRSDRQCPPVPQPDPTAASPSTRVAAAAVGSAPVHETIRVLSPGLSRHG